MRNPRVFVGSSVESLHIANAISDNLEFDAEVTTWNSGTFNLSSTTIDSLIEKSKSVDFSVFIFSPDDLTIMRSREQYVVRDNVVFELGLFVGSIGKERCFIVKPRGVELHFPSDLLGINPADYNPNRSDHDLVSSLKYASNQIKREIKEKGNLIQINSSQVQKIDVSDVLNRITDSDLLILSTLLDSYNHDVEGCASWDFKNKLQHQIPATSLNLSIIKLERINLIQKKNSSDFNGNEYFTYSLTNDGIDVCLKNEKRIFDLSKQPNPRKGYI